MILALACSVIALGPGQAPTPIAVPTELAEQSVTMRVQTSATHFAAENLGAQLQLILVGEPGFGALTSLTLTPGQRVEHVLPSKASGALWIEVLEQGTLQWSASGAIALDSVQGTGSALWIERSGEDLITWLALGSNDIQLASRRGRLAKGALGVVAAPHVPGAPPANKGGDTPPKVPDKTLPPF